MTLLTKIIFIGVTMIFLTCCKGDKFDSNDIRGTWINIFNDSIYGEVIFTDSKLWEWSTEAGAYVDNYRIEGDSFKIEKYTTSKFVRKNKDEFEVINKQFTVKYYRLKEKVDTAGLLRDDDDAIDKYVTEWRERKYNWEQAVKKVE